MARAAPARSLDARADRGQADDLIGAEVFGAAFAAGCGLANLFGLRAPLARQILEGLFFSSALRA